MHALRNVSNAALNNYMRGRQNAKPWTHWVLTVTSFSGWFFDHVLERFVESDDAMLRSQLLRALASTKDEGLAARARALALDPRVRVNEVWVPLGAQMGMPETREATWGFLQENFDALVERLESSAGFLPRFAGAFCSEEQAEAVQGFFQPRIAELPGGPRNLLNTLEAVRLCAAKVEAQQESARSYFGR